MCRLMGRRHHCHILGLRSIVKVVDKGGGERDIASARWLGLSAFAPRIILFYGFLPSAVTVKLWWDATRFSRDGRCWKAQGEQTGADQLPRGTGALRKEQRLKKLQDRAAGARWISCVWSWWSRRHLGGGGRQGTLPGQSTAQGHPLPRRPKEETCGFSSAWDVSDDSMSLASLTN